MLFHDGLVGLRIERRADIADHVLCRITRIHAQDFRIGRVGQIVEKPHRIAVQQFVDGVVLEIAAPLERRRATDHGPRIVAAFGPEPAEFLVDKNLHRHDIRKRAADSALFRHGRVIVPGPEIDLGLRGTRLRLRQ